ncbi:hypothetical protein VHUM_01687 [Vanrija humicola]|uniref:tRNA pseudouridine(55) synthase n=1 Tax=Vanrija humicola TaxID=5417 RepID=A0A7D8Z0H3_VANHU|nr:hypothetical protein VHUM_01687 [Vanrija humicola]
MQVIEAINPLLLESRLFEDSAKGEQHARNIANSKFQKRKRNTTNEGLKIGQGGTLDPLADGVLVIGVNRGTKHLQRFLDCTKEYESIGILGATTTTMDAEGEMMSTCVSDSITREDVESVLDKFRGKIMQTPPIFSALKMDGKPLYEYAREGKPLPRAIPTRECEVSIELVDFKPAEVVPGDGGHTYRWPEKRLSPEETATFRKLDQMVSDAAGDAPAQPKLDFDSVVPEVSEKTGLRPATFTVRMTVSRGTYVRSIVHDIGLALGCGAHVVKLTRTRQGEFVLLSDEAALKAHDEAQAAAAAAPDIDDEEAAMNAGPSSSSSAQLGQNNQTIPCIPWEVFQRALKERTETIEAEKAEREEMVMAGASGDEINQKLGKKAILARRRQGDLKEWEVEVLRRFVPVSLPIVRDSKSRAAGLY